MCGLVGEVLFGNIKNERSLSRELEILKHRGPDGQGEFQIGPCVLGHVRLSILDLSDAGLQPFHSSCGRWHLVYNGEIYNYLEIKKELESAGATFKTATDTEVLLELLIRQGLEGLHRCNGMWAFALWDSKEQELLLCRDRFGIKPLYVRQERQSLRFASEIKALWNPGEVPEVDRPSLYHFIDRNEGFQNEKTVYKGITKLLPGYALRLKGGQVNKKPWYQLPLEPTTLIKKERENYFKELFSDAIRLRLRSDVPVGVCLSGGLDSSAIVGVITKKLTQPIQTFSSIHREAGYSEGAYIQDVVDFCGVESYRLTPSVDSFEQILKNLIWAHDRPVRMPGTYSHWHVMQCAKDHVTVLLDGQGADELWGGYPYFFPSAQLGWLKRGLDLTAWKYFFQSLKGMTDNGLLHHEKTLFSRIFRSFVQKKAERMRWQDQVATPEFITEGKRGLPGEIKEPFQEPLNNHLYRSFISENLPMLLDFEDRISMAWSLEARVPFLDHRLVEFAFSLPPDEKIKGYQTKSLLRRSLRDVLPPSVANRKDKLGFPTPTEHWFRGPLKNFVESRLLDPSVEAHGFFDRPRLQKLWHDHLSGRHNHERLLWRVLSIETWAGMMLDRPPENA